MDPKENIPEDIKQYSPTIKTIASIGAGLVLLAGIQFGLLGGLVGGMLAGIILKQAGVVAPNSALVSETKGVKVAKYILLAVVLLVLVVFGVLVFLNQ